MTTQEFAKKIAEQSSLLSYGFRAPRIDEFVEQVAAQKPRRHRIAIIGSAGRKADAPRVSEASFNWIVQQCSEQTTPTDCLISGGAAFADHAAVVLALRRGNPLVLELPAPWDRTQHCFSTESSAGRTSNYYHREFAKACGWEPDHSLLELDRAVQLTTTEVHVVNGFFARNSLIAESCSRMLAFTFSAAEPRSGGTGNTWNKCKVADKKHFQILF